MTEPTAPTAIEGGGLPLNAYIESLTPKVGKFVKAIDPSVFKIDSLLIASRGKPLTNRSQDAFFNESTPIIHRACYPAFFGIMGALPLNIGEMTFIHAYPLTRVLAYKADAVCARLGELWLVPGTHEPKTSPVIASIIAITKAEQVIVDGRPVRRNRWLLRIQSGTHYLSKGIRLTPGYYEVSGLDPIESGSSFMEKNLFEVKPASAETMAVFPTIRAAVLGSTLPTFYQWSNPT